MLASNNYQQAPPQMCRQVCRSGSVYISLCLFADARKLFGVGGVGFATEQGRPAAGHRGTCIVCAEATFVFILNVDWVENLF